MDLSSASDFHFLQPLWLWALLPLWLIAAWIGWRRSRDGGWSQVIDAELLPALRMQAAERRHSPWWLLGLIWTLASLALAGPAWQREQSPVFRAPADWLLVLDLSPSMAASDLAPDRITRARYAVADILDAARDARVGLVVFANDAHVVAPLTTDVATVRALLPPLAPNLMPEAGDRLAPALNEASRLLGAAASPHAQVVLFSDGIADPSQALQAAQRLRQQGARLYVIGVGTTAGAPEPDSSGAFVQDAQGHSVISRLPADQLQRLAAAGGGTYASMNGLGSVLAELNAAHANQLDEDQRDTTYQVDIWCNAGVWLLPPLLLLVPLLARRGWI